MNDAEIVRRVLDGDVNAYALLVDAHSAQIMGIAARHVPPDRAAEVAHDTFVRAFERLATYKGESPFVHWLTRIALRRCADFWRGRARSRETPFSALGTGAREWIESIPDSAAEDVDAHAERNEAGVILDWALAQLTPDDRQVLVMTHMDGQALNDVAELMGWSLSKVKVRSHRARRKLRDVLGRMLD
ncbi:RNA polymerase sigma-70 factor, ECF subfamily [Humidesulfovibrio mexicanus]|uniref:RNA polymerase sigma-70 factor, ECF subfamily n=1 Tax=Humidesulfovibrio mexicanus TaxID=147047 RepID=A0A238ZB95_9BACT|nr:RNA polymerase sigma factor [Humidesulfovibrio mexicanus]SNR80627.1 RNA polymerase sigma-70 factor, ECF subfamily [Humidesulfovibrio mexicanus]